MNYVHGTHCASGIIEYPFLIEIYIASRQRCAQFINDICDDRRRVVSMGGDGANGEIVQLGGSEDVEIQEVCFEIRDQRAEKCQDEGYEKEVARTHERCV